jgi:hypothetical protein
MELIGVDTRPFCSLDRLVTIDDDCDDKDGECLVMGTRILVDVWFNPTAEGYNHRSPDDAAFISIHEHKHKQTQINKQTQASMRISVDFVKY